MDSQHPSKAHTRHTVDFTEQSARNLLQRYWPYFGPRALEHGSAWFSIAHHGSASLIMVQRGSAVPIQLPKIHTTQR